MGPQEGVRPAFYALRRGGWRDYVTLLHAPYTLWNLAYVALGAGLAPQFHLDRMLWAMAAFFLALGVAAHALDELNGRPLQTRIPSPVLVGLAVVGLGGAVAIGIGAAVAWGYGLLVFVATGGIAVPVYNLELFGGRDPQRASGPALVGRPDRAEQLLGRSADSSGRRDPGGRVRDSDDRRPAHAVDTGAHGSPPARRHGERGATEARCACSPWANILLGAAPVAQRLRWLR